jgi:hypothetical protein
VNLEKKKNFNMLIVTLEIFLIYEINGTVYKISAV